MIKKVLVQKSSNIVDDDGTILRHVAPKIYYVENIDKDYNTSFGNILKSDLEKDGEIVKTNKGKEFYIFNATFMDSYGGLRKIAQTIPLKDLGFILARLGLNEDSVMVDTGSGSGGSACFLGMHVKKVYSYDINDKHLAQTKENIEYFGLKNVDCEKHNVYDSIPVKNVDAVLLDLPEPWKAVESVALALRVGGYIIAYCPQITQSQEFINTIMSSKMQNGKFMQVSTVEIVERDWKVDGEIVRPRSLSNIHSGFISIVRKIN